MAFTLLKRYFGLMWIALSQILLMGVNLVILKLMTTSLSVESFGLYSLAMTIILFFRQVIYDPISYVVVKDCGSASRDSISTSEGLELARFITNRFATFLVSAALLFLSFEYLVLGGIEFSVIFFFSVVYLCSNGAQGIYLAILNITGRRSVASACSIFDSLLKLILVYLVLNFFGGKMIDVLIAVAASTFVVCFSANRYFNKYIGVSSLPVNQFKSRVFIILAKSLPLFLPVFLAALRGVGDRWVLTSYIGVDELAAFTVLLQIGYFPVILLVGVIQTFVAPKVYALSSSDIETNYNDLRRFLSLILSGIFILAVVGGGIATILAGYIFNLFVGKVYGFYASYLVFFVISGAVTAAGSILHLAVIGVFNSKIAGRLMLISVVFGVFSALALIIMYGFRGGVAAMLVTSFFSTLLYYVVLYFDIARLEKGRSII